MEERNVLIGVSGSVAAIKLPELVKKLTDCKDVKINVRVVSTKSALHFYELSDVPAKVYTDPDEWKWTKIGDPVLHIELRKWADLLVLAPLDANTMAKIASGLCDNLLTCIVRAWDLKHPLIFCPAMNTFMWEHPLTASHIHSLTQLGYIQVPPVSKLLACGDQGMGALATVDNIIRTVVDHL